MQRARGRDQLHLKMASMLTRTWTQPTRSARSLMGLAHEQHPLTHGPSPRAARAHSRAQRTLTDGRSTRARADGPARSAASAWCSSHGVLQMVLFTWCFRWCSSHVKSTCEEHHVKNTIGRAGCLPREEHRVKGGVPHTVSFRDAACEEWTNGESDWSSDACPISVTWRV